MTSRKGAAFGEFHRSVHQVTSTKSFRDKFQELCKKSDRPGILKMLLDLKEVQNLRIEQSYHEKNDKEALNLFETYLKTNEDETKKINILTKALFASNPGDLFTKILLERAKLNFKIGAYFICSKDCDYLSGSKKSQFENELNELKTKCRDAMKRLNKIASKNGRRNAKISLPRVEGKENGVLKSCSDALSLSRDKIRGRHLVSRRNIKNGSVLIVDEPFSFSTDFQALKTNCLHCQISLQSAQSVAFPCSNCQSVAYCSNNCREKSWHDFHRFECRIFDYFFEKSVRDIDQSVKSVQVEQRSHLLLAWRTTIGAAIDKSTNRLIDTFFSDHEKSMNKEVSDEIVPYDPKDYRTIMALETHCADSSTIVNLDRSLKSIFLAKSLEHVLANNSSGEKMTSRQLLIVAVAMLRHIQAVDCNAYEIVENFRDETTKIWEPRNVGGAIYPTVSLVNHSCYPNVVRHSFPGGKVVVRALRFIEKGAEILDCYGPHFVSDSKSARLRYLQEKYHFTCKCVACSNNYELPEVEKIIFKCSCGASLTESSPKCAKCGRTNDVKKLVTNLTKSVKKRLSAISKMFDGNYEEVLPNLLDHGTLVDKILAEPSLEAIKTQQSIVQCYNSLSSTCPAIDT